MHIQPVPWAAPNPPNPRPEGLHVSTIIRDLAQTLGLYPAGDDRDEDLVAAYLFLGCAFEDRLESLGDSGRDPSLAGVRPDPLQVDGVWLSADRISLAGPDLVVEEHKLTWKTARGVDLADRKWWPWILQLQAYCWAFETTLGRLRVFFVNGTYAPPRPLVRRWDLTFTPEELRESWAMLLAHARTRGWLQETV